MIEIERDSNILVSNCEPKPPRPCPWSELDGSIRHYCSILILICGVTSCEPVAIVAKIKKKMLSITKKLFVMICDFFVMAFCENFVSGIVKFAFLREDIYLAKIIW